MKLEDVKANLLKPVLYDCAEYIFKECILWLDQKEHRFSYSGILVDKAINSCIRVPLERIDKL